MTPDESDRPDRPSPPADPQTSRAYDDTVALAVTLLEADAACLARLDSHDVAARPASRASTVDMLAHTGFGATVPDMPAALCERLARTTTPVLLKRDGPTPASVGDDPLLPAGWAGVIGVPLNPGDGTPWAALAVFYRDGSRVPADAAARLSRLGRQAALVLAAVTAGPTSRLAQHLERAQRIAELGSWEHRVREERLDWSDEIFRIFGIDRASFAATFDAFIALVHPDDRASMHAAHDRVMTGELPLDFVHRIVRPDGTVRVVRERGELYAEGGDVVLAGTIQDITAQAEVERQLRESEERFRELAETIEDAFWTWDAIEDRILYVSPSYETVFGQSRAELYRDSRSFQRVIDPEDLPRLIDAVARDAYAINIEYRVVRPDGERRWIDVRTFPVRSPDGTVLRTVGIGRDVTRLKTAEEALLRTQRMESIGTLAGGIAHDLNNVLTPIVMAAGLLQATPRHAGDAELIETISASAERGAAMVRQVLAFARGVDGQRVPLRIDEVVADVTRLIRDTFDRRIVLDVHVQPGLWSVAGDATQMHQVLLNLAVNARDAMSAGGTLRIEARNVHVGRVRAAAMPDGRPGRYVVLVVADSGAGIPPALQTRVFDPFFTTKPHGQGTGLGLSTVQSLVRSHGGFLALESEVGRGTTFTVYLPALEDAGAANGVDDRTRVPRGEGRLVLVVDDEESVRAVTRVTLESFGYRVATAVNGADALAALRAAPEAFDAVVTDMMMPVADGYAVIAGARQLRADLPIVASSGLETTQMLERVAAAGVRHFLSKPYPAEQLLLTLASAIAAGTADGGDASASR